MKRIFFIIGLLIPLITLGQSEKVFVIADSTLAERWTILANDWRYQKGDNMAWANPDFDDASWSELSYYNLNMPDGETIADRGEIVWFRKRIKANSSLTKTIVLNISQLGASEIYLDGKLIHQLGEVSSDLEKVIYNNPYSQVLQLPLEKGKEQVMAVRYVNAQYKFPMYTTTNGYLRISASTLSNANSKDVIKNNRIAYNLQFEKNYHISLGISICMFIIFAAFYFFFPNEKINGYFAISNLFLIFFTLGIISSIGYSGVKFWIAFLYGTCILLHGIILLYCYYKVMRQSIDLSYKVVCVTTLITIACFFLYNPDTLGASWALLMYFAIIRVAIKSWNQNRVASILFISASVIGFLYWTIYVLTSIGLAQIYIGEFIPFAFMLNPIVLALYLGYSFGQRSQLLRLNLERVQKLSKEKESILSQQNEKLEQQVKERTASLNTSLENLKATQDQLIHSEKMASLGELTAGIAHEIQNPLNFVNNFSDLNSELIEELKEAVAQNDQEEVKSLLADLAENEGKINHHGKRAENIVKSMLQHSRTSSGKRELTDINALADEYLRLAYHGLRAKDKNGPTGRFNADFKSTLDETLPKVKVIPQDIGRVLLNLINNAFQATAEKAKSSENGYMPTVEVITRKKDDTIEIIIKDNGPGISKELQEKIFQPFFTTKPTGSGTGLGLSLSYDIVKAHGGELIVESITSEGSATKQTETVFTIILRYNA